MSRLILIVLLLLAIGLQVAGWPQVTYRVLPDFTLAAVLAWTLSRNLRGGLEAAVFAGLLLDLYAQHSFGRFLVGMLLAYGIIAALTRGNQLEDLGLGYVLIVTSGAIVSYELWILIITNLTTDAFPFLAELRSVATLNSIATLIVFVCLLPIARVLAARLPLPYEGRPV